MRLFDYHGNLLYTLGTKKDEVVIKNILQKVNIRASIKDEASAFAEYEVVDGERPEHIAHRVYGSVNYHWVILLMNDICNPFYDWLLTEDEVVKLTDKRYGVLSRNALHHYIDVEGNIIQDEANIPQLEYIRKYSVTNLEHEIQENEKRRKVKILDPAYLSIVEGEIKELLK